MTHDGNMKRIYLEHVKPLTHDQLTERRNRIDWQRLKYLVNRLPSEVYVLDRSGTLTEIAPNVTSTTFEPDFLFICEQIQCSPEARNEYIRQARNTPLSMRQHTHHALLGSWTLEPPHASRYSVEVLCGLDAQTLLDNKVVYLEDHDMVVMYGLSKSEAECVYHPYSKAGYTASSFQQIRNSNEYVRKGDFTLNIRIVDNNDAFGNRWVLIENEPHCIVAVKDPEVTDGIYVTYSDNLLNGAGPQRLMSDRYALEGDKKLPYKLYRSRQEALSGRQDAVVRELEAKAAELESKATAAETGLLKAKQERENIEREAELRARKHRQDMDKLQREHERMQEEHDLFLQKQLGEMMSVDRKNTTELIKCVPVMITTVMAILAAFKKK